MGISGVIITIEAKVVNKKGLDKEGLNKGSLVYSHERLDDLQCGGYHIIQDPKKFCFGIDAVCLSNFVKIKKGDRVLDLGTGTGIIPILLSAKTDASHITGLEIQPDMADMAQRSVKLNDLCDRIKIDCGDIKKPPYAANHFDVVTVNPPYMNDGGGVYNESESKTIARHEVLCTLSDVISASARLLKTGGRLYMVHRPHRLMDVLCTLRKRNLEPKTMQFVQSGPVHEPSLVLIEALDHGKPMLKVLPTEMSR